MRLYDNVPRDSRLPDSQTLDLNIPVAKLFLKRADQNDLDLFGEERDDSIPEGGTAGYGTEFLSELNPIQREAVTASEGPLLIVAGAGSGKTRVLTYRVAFLLAKGVKPWNILALTFTNKAAAEMKERISRLVGEERARPLWMGTFHSVFSRVLRREAEKLGYTASFTIYDTDDSLGVVRTAMAQFGISSQDFSPKAIHNRISAAKNAMISPAQYSNQASDLMEEKIALVYQQYEQRLRTSPGVRAVREEVQAAVRAGELPAAAAAERLLAAFDGGPDGGLDVGGRADD